VKTSNLTKETLKGKKMHSVYEKEKKTKEEEIGKEMYPRRLPLMALM
jgi:hypothetical protein